MSNASQIRNDSKQGFGDPVGSQEQAAIHFLAEIAAQLAELKVEVSRLADIVSYAAGGKA